MKITKENWLKATAKAMSNEPTQELFGNVPEMFDIFSEYAFMLFKSLKNEEHDFDSYAEIASTVCAEIKKGAPTGEVSTMIVIALITLSVMIWESLDDSENSSTEDKEKDSFKAVLKSYIS
jgi:hypothetical protein